MLSTVPEGSVPAVGRGYIRRGTRRMDRAGVFCAVLGTAAIWMTLPAVGALIFGEVGKGLGLLTGAGVCLTIVLNLAGRGQRARSSEPDNP